MSENEEGASNTQRLLAAAREDNEELLLDIFEKGNFDINFQDGVGNTGKSGRGLEKTILNPNPAWLNSFTHCVSVQNGSTDVLEHILSHEECDVDPINRIQRATPLHLACQLKYDGMRAFVVESLLEAGANTKIRDKNGELAESFVPPNDQETRKLFRKAQAQAVAISQDDIASDDDGEVGSGSGSDED
ncbi:hypothetical protein BDP27DRAFT_1412724 [Rhodocollybia butyracea]|uniref:Ankyrin repeat protein n=1 Tax=Rhodocollybia butyracea TaxID=206335 RepID=A0A9P5QB14_9AGAR|nr:hypothetical protein BDP27DRAFT_1412724 [Rhodocollybia butyracea]